MENININVQTLSTIMQRAALAGKLGVSYGGKRNIYEALGYPDIINYEDYTSRYLRQDIAAAIINRPAEATWRGPVYVTENQDEETQFEKQYKALENDLGLKAKFQRVDKLSGLGTHAILYLGLSDIKMKQDAAKPISQGQKKLLYIKPFGEGSAEIKTYDRNPSSPRYGMPETYQLHVSLPGSNAFDTIIAHHSRCIHITRELLESEIEGIPSLKRVYNRLMDIEKLVGGSAEMFWRGARPGLKAQAHEGYEMSPDVEKDLKEQLTKFDHDLERFLTVQGTDVETMSPQVSDPSSHLDIQLQMISAFTGIPKRMLTGSERGELASSQDREAWLEMIQGRREEFAETKIVRPFVDKLVELGILPEPSEEYGIHWMDLFASSAKEKAEVAKAKTEALKAYADSGASIYMPFDKYMIHVLEFSQELADEITEAMKGEEQAEQEFQQENPEE